MRWPWLRVCHEAAVTLSPPTPSPKRWLWIDPKNIQLNHMKLKNSGLQKCHFHMVQPNNLCFPDFMTEMIQENPTERISILLKQKIFFYCYSPPWCGKNYGGKARTQEGNIWMEQAGSIFLWSCDKLANGTSRVRGQKDSSSSVPPPLSLLSPSPLSGVLSQSTSSESDLCPLGTWRSHVALSGIPQNFFWFS